MAKEGNTQPIRTTTERRSGASTGTDAATRVVKAVSRAYWSTVQALLARDSLEGPKRCGVPQRGGRGV